MQKRRKRVERCRAWSTTLYVCCWCPFVFHLFLRFHDVVYKLECKLDAAGSKAQTFVANAACQWLSLRGFAVLKDDELPKIRSETIETATNRPKTCAEFRRFLLPDLTKTNTKNPLS